MIWNIKIHPNVWQQSGMDLRIQALGLLSTIGV